MSLNQIIKIPSEQSAFDTSGSKNNVDFTLPAGEVYDLSKSYIAISVDELNLSLEVCLISALLLMV